MIDPQSGSLRGASWLICRRITPARAVLHRGCLGSPHDSFAEAPPSSQYVIDPQWIPELSDGQSSMSGPTRPTEEITAEAEMILTTEDLRKSDGRSLHLAQRIVGARWYGHPADGGKVAGTTQNSGRPRCRGRFDQPQSTS